MSPLMPYAAVVKLLQVVRSLTLGGSAQGKHRTVIFQ